METVVDVSAANSPKPTGTWSTTRFSDQRPAPSIVDALEDDLNTVAAIQALGALAKEAESGDVTSGSLLLNSIAFLGIEAGGALPEELVERVELLLAVEDRLAHLAAKNFAEADRIRDELAAQGIQLMDYKDPDTGERKTRWEVKR